MKGTCEHVVWISEGSWEEEKKPSVWLAAADTDEFYVQGFEHAWELIEFIEKLIAACKEAFYPEMVEEYVTQRRS